MERTTSSFYRIRDNKEFITILCIMIRQAAYESPQLTFEDMLIAIQIGILLFGRLNSEIILTNNEGLGKNPSGTQRLSKDRKELMHSYKTPLPHASFE